MQIDVQRSQKLFELVPLRPGKGIVGTVIAKKRLLIGRSSTCDLMIDSPRVSAIHAVLEIVEGGAKIYDMNSTNGTFINGKKIVAEICPLAGTVKFADVEFQFKEYREEDLLPPVLDMLPPTGAPPAIEKRPPAPPSPSKMAPPAPTKSTKVPEQPKKLPKSALPQKAPARSAPEVPRVMYPLASDPKAEFSEYIFEDVETLWPIFKYEVGKNAVEVIIMYLGTIYSVDYLPNKNGTYFLVGNTPKADQLEWPYLAKNEKFPLVEVRNGEVFVSRPPGHDHLYLGDDMKSRPSESSGPFLLGPQDILRFHKQDLQIFVRNTEAPPKVSPAPFFRRDKLLGNYMLLATVLASMFYFGLYAFKEDKELEKEKVPERIASIVYKKKLIKPKVELKKDEQQKVAQTPKQEAKKPEPPKEKPQEKPQEKPEVKVAKQDPVKFKEKVDQPKKGETPKGDPSKAISANKPDNKPSAASKSPAPKTSTSERPKASAPNPTVGHVDTYKAADFQSTVSSLLSRGGGKAQVKGAATNSQGSLTNTSITGTGEGGGGLERAKVSQNIGSLAGSAQGKLIGSTSAEGLVDKKAVYTAGIPSETMVLGSMDPDIIRSILRDHIPQFRYCYQKELDRATEEFSGVIDLNFVIGASGHVTTAGVTAKSALPATVKSCVVNVLRGIKFPEPLGGGTVEVKQPINFYPTK